MLLKALKTNNILLGRYTVKEVINMLRNAKGNVLPAFGLLGIAGYELAFRLLHMPMFSNDLFHGIWIGACIGLEICGVYSMGRSRC